MWGRYRTQGSSEGGSDGQGGGWASARPLKWSGLLPDGLTRPDWTQKPVPSRKGVSQTELLPASPQVSKTEWSQGWPQAEALSSSARALSWPAGSGNPRVQGTGQEPEPACSSREPGLPAAGLHAPQEPPQRATWAGLSIPRNTKQGSVLRITGQGAGLLTTKDPRRVPLPKRHLSVLAAEAQPPECELTSSRPPLEGGAAFD